jgi:hypothetical protein
MYVIGTPYWNNGYATELGAAWVNYAFRHAGLQRLVVGPARANVASVRVLEKLGFRIEDDPLKPESVVAFLEHTRCDGSSAVEATPRQSVLALGNVCRSMGSITDTVSSIPKRESRCCYPRVQR